MSTQANSIPEFRGESQVAYARIPSTQRMYWSVRRELWESRSLYLAPLGVAGLFLFGFFISMIHFAAKMREISGLDPGQQRDVIAKPYHMAALLLMATALIVGVFYCLDALHGERRDRSILFWKSLPVSDLTTVLSKASIPLVLLPLFTFALTFLLQFVMLILSSAVLLGNGSSVALLWSRLSFFEMSLMLLYHLVTVHAIWHAPIYAWLLLVSSWARRAVFLWAALPVLAIAMVEKIAFNTSHFGAMLGNRLGGGPEALASPGVSPMDPMIHLTPGNYLMSPGLWIGLIVTAVFLAGAVRMRRYRGPI